MHPLIITGGSRGIGASISRLAGELGYPVVVNFSESEREANSIVRTIEQAGGRAMAVRANIAREAEVIELFQTAEQAFGYVGGVVNNAATTGGFSRVESVTTETLERVLAVNVTGTILCAREAVRRMSTRHGGKGGAIVNISSLVARTGGAGEWVHYAASKGAVNSFTIGLAREVAGEGIRVNAVSPGLIETELHARNGDPGRVDRMSPTVPMQRGGRPEEIAAGVLWLLSPEASYTTGAVLEIGGGR
jgi:NAD(P)-dependent dehydrogenase (short-subunit alcohol dehydrogenase family)